MRYSLSPGKDDRKLAVYGGQRRGADDGWSLKPGARSRA
jgi:hypothetical protein